MSRLPKPSALTLWQAFGGIREAIAVLQTGSNNDVQRLCARRAGWDVLLREGGKIRPMVKLRAELRQSLLSATRRHLEARGTVMEIVASPGGDSSSRTQRRFTSCCCLARRLKTL